MHARQASLVYDQVPARTVPCPFLSLFLSRSPSRSIQVLLLSLVSHSGKSLHVLELKLSWSSTNYKMFHCSRLQRHADRPKHRPSSNLRVGYPRHCVMGCRIILLTSFHFDFLFVPLAAFSHYRVGLIGRLFLILCFVLSVPNIPTSSYVRSGHTGRQPGRGATQYILLPRPVCSHLTFTLITKM